MHYVHCKKFISLRAILYVGLGYCNYETTDEGTRGLFSWNETEVKTTASTSCLYGPTEEMPTRQCVFRLNWAAPSVSQCRTVVSTQFSNIQQVSSVMMLTSKCHNYYEEYLYTIGECQC